MKRCGLALVIGFFVFLATNTICHTAEDTAMVIDIKNGKAYYEAGEKKGQEVTHMDFLTEGDQIRLTPRTVLILNYFASGLREEMAGPGSFTVGKSSSKREDDVITKADRIDYLPPKSAIRKGDIQQTGAVVLRTVGGLSKITILSLSDTAVRSAQPVFRWQPVEGAETYKLRVFDVQDKLFFEITTDTTSFTYSKSDLHRGDQYWWTVLAMARGKIFAKGEGQFSVITEESLEKLIQAEREIIKQYPQESTESMVSLAMIYENHELFDDAADIFRKLHEKYPHNKNIINHLKMLDPNFMMK